MSTKNAGSAKKMGYKNVRVYLDGEPAWTKAGNPLYASKGFVEKGNIVLIDLRTCKKSEAGRIPRSVTIPYETLAVCPILSLEDMVDEIPTKAPVVLYSDSEDEVLSALEDLRDEGYKKVSLVPGNFNGWVNGGGRLEKGPVVTKVEWKRKLGKGEVSKADFLKAATGADSSAVILDVRTKDEAAGGKFKDAYAIPLDELGGRLSELPQDKKVYIHCTTGARADMAAQELNKNGYKAFFLVASVECDGNECEVED
jgi:rhodanese-related sulfurtransferase